MSIGLIMMLFGTSIVVSPTVITAPISPEELEYEGGWQYRTPFSITNKEPHLLDMFAIPLDGFLLNDKVKEDFSDIRVMSIDNKFLPYITKDGILVIEDTIMENQTKDYWLYYGNPLAVSEETVITKMYKPKNGLVGYWSFEDVVDETGLNEVVSVSNVEHVEGICGKCVQFAGDGKIELDDNLGFTSDMSFTISAWVKTIRDDGAILGKSSIDISGRIGYLLWFSDGKIRFDLERRGVGQLTIQTPTRYDDGIWHHIVVVYHSDTETVIIYVDGSKQAEGYYQFGGLQATELPFCFGIMKHSIGEYIPYIGCIDEVGIWNRAFGYNEVLALYHRIPLYNVELTIGDEIETDISIEPEIISLTREQLNTITIGILPVNGYIGKIEPESSEFYVENEVFTLLFDTVEHNVEPYISVCKFYIRSNNPPSGNYPIELRLTDKVRTFTKTLTINWEQANFIIDFPDIIRLKVGENYENQITIHRFFGYDYPISINIENISENLHIELIDNTIKIEGKIEGSYSFTITGIGEDGMVVKKVVKVEIMEFKPLIIEKKYGWYIMGFGALLFIIGMTTTTKRKVLLIR